MGFLFNIECFDRQAAVSREPGAAPAPFKFRPQKIQTPPPPHGRREAERFKVNLDARWNGYFEHQHGSVTDISAGGCFILTAGEVSVMELIEVDIRFAPQSWARLWGQVVYHNEDIGFALRFVNDGSHEGFTQLARFIEDTRAARAEAL